MDNELKKMRDLEKQKLELKAALEKELLKAELINYLIETANEQPGVDMKKITIPPYESPSKS